MDVRSHHKFILVAIGFILSSSCNLHAKDKVLDTMANELNRSFHALQEQDKPPYFLSYEITQDEVVVVNGSFGQVTSVNNSLERFLDIDIRVGDYFVDNTHPISVPIDPASYLSNSISKEVPIGDQEALTSVLWILTDKYYKDAVVRLTQVQSMLQAQVARFDLSGDFSQTRPETYVEDEIELDVDTDLLKQKIELYTSAFSDVDHIRNNGASISANIETRWLVNSEGTRVKVSHPFFRLIISATTKADDGMVLLQSLSYEGTSQEDLLQDAQILSDVQESIKNLKTLRSAPLVDPYTGPGILVGQASGVFFHQVLGHRLEGHRFKSPVDDQTLFKQLNKKILPDSISVAFDPTVQKYGNTPLFGTYRFDNQGVKARRVVVVDHGILKGFLVSRKPLDGFPTSNGHGRKNKGGFPLARQSNMFVEAHNPVSYEQLEQMLIDRIQGEGRPFGLILYDLQAGAANIGGALPNAFNLAPTLVHKVYSDGTKEVVRGVNLIGTPLDTLELVEQAADDYTVYNGVSEGRSGLVPIATVAPSILFSQLEVQKAATSRDSPPILPSPIRPAAERSLRSHQD